MVDRLETYEVTLARCPVCGEYAGVFVRNPWLDELVCQECNGRENAAAEVGYE